MLIVGVDIGGTKIRGILWDQKRVIRTRESSTPKNKIDFQKRVLNLIAALASKQPISRIGIGAAGIIEKTILIFSPNIPYIKKFAFRALWPGTVALRLDNDARCFARAEFLMGAGRGRKRLFALTLGTGVGRAYGRNGKIIKIKKFEYPERWERKYQLIQRSQDDEKLINFLGEKLSPLLKPFKPEAIVVGGGVTGRRSFLKKLQAEFKKRALLCPVRRAKLGKNAGALGAALLFH